MIVTGSIIGFAEGFYRALVVVLVGYFNFKVLKLRHSL